MNNSNPTIMPGAGPFYFKGSKIGILMVHGAGGGTCADLKPLAEDLHIKGGYTVRVPLLPGFGSSPEDLKNTQIDEWKSALEQELTTLMEICDSIIVGGHSIGGVLTLILASNYYFDGIFIISAPAGVQSFLINLVPLFKIFVKYYKIPSEHFRKDTNGKWIGYDKIPVNIGIKAKKLMKEMKQSLIKIDSPILLFQGRLDSDIKKNSMNYIFSNISSKNKRKIWLEHNGHPILCSPDHNQIVSELFNFINEICP